MQMHIKVNGILELKFYVNSYILNIAVIANIDS